MTDQPFFSVEIQNRRLNFSSFDEISNWLQRERTAFEWMMNSDWGPAFNNLRESYRNGHNNIATRLAEWRNDPANDQRPQNLAQFFQALYSQDTLVLSDHPFAKIANEAASKMSAAAGVGAFAALLGIPCTVNFDVVRGMTAAKLTAEGIDPKSPTLVAETIKNLNSTADEEFKRRDDAWNAVAKTAQEGLLQKEISSQTKVDEISAQAAAFFERLDNEGNAVIKLIQDTEASYREQMTLQAPVEYWATKAAGHRSDLAKSRGRLVWFTVLGSGGLILALVGLSWLASLIADPKNADSTAIYLKFAAAGAILTTIIFWVGRVLLRIYLSDRHLLTDAEERVAMIKTYLALSNEKKVDAAERALILAPIFRSAADGIVKEEGPDASVAGLLARALDSRRP